MTDHSDQGATHAADAGMTDPPTVDEVLERQRADRPDQASTSTRRSAPPDDELATAEAGGDVVGRTASGGAEIEGPNSA